MNNRLKDLFSFGIYGLLAAIFFASSGQSAQTSVPEPTEPEISTSKPIIYKLKPERKDGRGYRLIYLVEAPLEVFWKFKTDFDNQFLLSNKFITAHRLVRRTEDEVITESEYSSKPGSIFKWQTTLFPDQHLLKFILLNPQECGQRYHYGYIQLEPLGSRTRVTQVAYFDFFGVSIWVNYPFYGGMSYFLKYTAAWEQQTILKLKENYEQ